MKKFINFCLVLFCLAALPVQQASAAMVSVLPIEQTTTTSATPVTLNKESLRQNKKEIKKQLKATKNAKAGADRTLCAIIAIFIPFLGVGLYMGITTEFWISLLLTFLFVLPGIIYALWVILR